MPCCATLPPRILVQREQPQETQAGPDLCTGLCWDVHHSLPEMTSKGEPAHTSQMAHPTKIHRSSCLLCPIPENIFKAQNGKVHFFFIQTSCFSSKHTSHLPLPIAQCGFGVHQWFRRAAWSEGMNVTHSRVVLWADIESKCWLITQIISRAGLRPKILRMLHLCSYPAASVP